jgi:hypothetical protein
MNGPSYPKERHAGHDNHTYLRIDAMVHEIQSDLWRLAVKVLGTTKELGWRHPIDPGNQPPLVPNVELDDVVILGGVKRYDFGIIHINEYRKWLSNSSTTLCIVTQPFPKGNFPRAADTAKGAGCRQVVNALVDCIHGFLPNTKVLTENAAEKRRIHPADTLALYRC